MTSRCVTETKEDVYTKSFPTSPTGEVGKLLGRYDTSEYYPGFMFSADLDVAFSPWLKVLSEMKNIETFRLVFNMPRRGFLEDSGIVASCEHVIVVE